MKPTHDKNMGHPHMGEGTIKDVYAKIKDHGDAKAFRQYMKNVKNQLRLVFWETTAGCNLECIHCRRLDVSTQLMNDDMMIRKVIPREGIITAISI